MACSTSADEGRGGNGTYTYTYIYIYYIIFMYIIYLYIRCLLGMQHIGGQVHIDPAGAPRQRQLDRLADEGGDGGDGVDGERPLAVEGGGLHLLCF